MLVRACVLGIALAILALGAQAETKIPHELEGKLITYRVGYAQCSMFLSKEGMAKGTVAPSCVLIPTWIAAQGGPKGLPFEILSVIETMGDD